MRLIDADKALEKISKMIDYCEKDTSVNGLTALFQVGDAIMDCKTVDAGLVKRGKWKFTGTDKNGDVYQCSNCELKIGLADETNYCPNCGAKMDLEEPE